MACSKGVTVATAQTRIRGACCGSLLRTCTASPKTWLIKTAASTESSRCRVIRFSMAELRPHSLSCWEHPLREGRRGRLPQRELFNRNFAQQFEIAEHFPRAQHDAGQGVVGDGDRQPGFLANTFVEILEQRAAAGQNDAAVADISGKLGRRALERHPNRVHDCGNALAERFPDFAVIHGDGFRYTLDEVAALNLHR